MNSPSHNLIRIAVCGDTHSRIDKIEKELKKEGIKHFLFTGDYYADAVRIASHLDITFDGVLGNCDLGIANTRNVKEEEILTIAGKKVYLVHGHQYGVKGNLNSLFYRGNEINADAVIFGHTHVPVCENINGVWLLNPGSPAKPRGTNLKGSYIIIDIGENYFNPEIIYLDN